MIKWEAVLLKQGGGNNNTSGNEVVGKALGQYAEYVMSKNRNDETREQLIETNGRHEFSSSKFIF